MTQTRAMGRIAGTTAGALALAWLSACGGGGGGQNPPAVSCPTSGASTSGPLALTTTQCADAVQGRAYGGCTLQASGGTPPYSFAVATDLSAPPLPEGMQLEACTGAVSSVQVGGQGYYEPMVVVTDAAGAHVSGPVKFSVAGRNGFLAQIFPSDSIFHHRVDSLPLDTSPAAPIPAVYADAILRPFFGNTSGAPFPNGIPVVQVPATQPLVTVTEGQGGYQSYFSQGPIPPYAPVEGTAHSEGDRHVLVHRAAGSGVKPALFEMWVATHNSDDSWGYLSNAQWLDTSSNALTPQGQGTSDAAGLPVAPLLVNADEVIGSGTPSAPSGAVRHPIRFTLNHILAYWVWPGTQTAGVGSCSDASGATLPTGEYLGVRPTSCTHSAPAGQIYRLKASVAAPDCAATSPQAAVIITGLRQYGIIVSDNGISGGLIGTPDSRWNDDDLSCLRSLRLADFEPVDVSGLRVSLDSGQTR